MTGQKDFDIGNGNSLFVRGEADYTGDTYFDISNDPISRRNPFAIFNGAIGYAPPAATIKSNFGRGI